MAASRARLAASDYEPVAVLEYSAADGWPADKAGRLLLALAGIEALTGHPEPRAAELVELLPRYLGDHGYMGPEMAGIVDEQQLAGHSWLVSGLLTHADNHPAGPAEQLARRIVESLLLPGIERMESYPLERSKGADGAAMGTVEAEIDGWRLSSDVYCVLITLDALVAAHRRAPDNRVHGAIRSLLQLLAALDLPGAGAQLHASLTAARCAAEYGEQVGDAEAIRLARRIYEQYASTARTVNRATFNWFGRPDSWTEPCAIVDSAMLAWRLWRVTGERCFLDDLHLIEHSALAHAQKAHGGFGLDTCATEDAPMLGCRELDASWCCTMRGATGLAWMRAATYRVVGDVVHIDLPHDGEATVLVGGCEVRLRQQTDYPTSGRVRVELVDGNAVRIAVSAPSWAHAPADVTVTRGASAEFDLGAPRWSIAQGTGSARFAGPALLGERDGEEIPVGDVFGWTPAEVLSRQLRVVHTC